MHILRISLLAAAVGCTPARQAPTTAPAPASAAGDSAARANRSGAVSLPNDNPFPSTYRPFPSRTTAIRNVIILTAAGPAIRNGIVLIRDGRIAEVGQTVAIPADATVIDGGGTKYVTPGLVDTHTHMGVYSAPGGDALSDGNEATKPVTAYVWSEHSVWPQDPQFPRAIAGGTTTVQVLPGSANLFGGRSVVLKVVPGRSVRR